MITDLKEKSEVFAKNEKELPPIERTLLFLIFVTSSMFLLQIRGKYFSLLFEVVFCVYMICKKKRIILPKYLLINLIIIEMFLAAIPAFFSEMPLTYRKTAIDLAIMTLPVYFTFVYIRELLMEGYDVLSLIIKAIKVMVLIQIGWFLMQTVLWYGLHIDLNKAVFVDRLHLVNNASFIRSWVYYPSGLTWHSAILAPLLVLAFILFERPVMRALILFVALLCGNSTALIGVVLTLVLLILERMSSSYGRISKNRLLVVFAVFFAAIAAVYLSGSMSRVVASVTRLYTRLFGAERDASTAAHFGYYKDYLTIFRNSSVPQIFLGYGVGCSGFTITKLYGRYTELSNWAIESDIVNILVSRGIVGFLLYYGFMFTVMLKGLKVDVRYFIFMAVVFIQGFGYNIQFDYVFLIEMLLYASIDMGDNFFLHNGKDTRVSSLSVRFRPEVFYSGGDSWKSRSSVSVITQAGKS